MTKSKKLVRMIMFSMLVAIGVVISPLLRVEGMCPMAHFINIVCSVLLGPWNSLLCALTIGIIRMATMGIPPIALTGAVFGAFLSGVFYKTSKGNLLMAVLGEVIGTGIIGAIISCPVMTFFWGREELGLFFYIPSFVCGTLIGGSIAFAFLKKLSQGGLLTKFQSVLGSASYNGKMGLLGDSIAIASMGVVLFTVISVLNSMFKINSQLLRTVSYLLVIGFVIAAAIYYISGCVKNGRKDN